MNGIGLRLAMMASAVFFLGACSESRTSSSVVETTSSECSSEALQNQFIVKYFDGRTEVVKAPSRHDFIDGFVTQNLDQIEFAEHDYKVHINNEAGTAMAASPVVNNWGTQRVEADALWSAGVNGQNVVVAVIDSGVDLVHSQLSSQIYINAGETGVDARGADKATNGKDDDGNGFADDVYGYDFYYGRPLKGDNTVHGSHVAGIIAAKHNDTVAGARGYVQGMAPQAKILPVAFLNEQGDGSMSDGVTAIKYAVARGAKVINASWGGTMCSRSLRDVVASLEAKGVVFVSASGNESSNIDFYHSYPASLNLAAQITVGATGEGNLTAEYSNYGATAVHIFAPGSNIVSTVPGGLEALTGTSMATPFVAGAAALLLSAEPTATAMQIRAAFAASAAQRTDYVNASHGRLNLRTALAELRKILGK